MDQTLKRWVAQSESWHTFVDFALPEERIARYPFLQRYDDFYISLVGQLFNLLNEAEPDKDECFSAAKGLEIYSLENTRDKFQGVNYYYNMLFAAGLYYLSGYSASAFLLANLLPLSTYRLPITVFISSFLRRELNSKNVYTKKLGYFLDEGDVNVLEELTDLIEARYTRAFGSSPFRYLFWVRLFWNKQKEQQ
jgi:helicase